MALTRIGPAAPGFPVTGAALLGEDLLLVGRNLAPTPVPVVDTRTWQVRRTLAIDRGDGAFATTTSPDGVHLGLLGARGQGNLIRTTASGPPQVRALLDTQFIWDLTTVGPDVIGVATNPSLVFAMRRADGQARALPVLTNTGQRPRTVTTVGPRLVVAGSTAGSAWVRHTARDGTDGRNGLPASLGADDIVYCSAATADGRLVIGTGGQDLRTPAVAVLDLDDPQGALVVRLPREALVDTVTVDGGVVYATARPSGALYRIDAATGAVSRVAAPVPQSETRETFVQRGQVLGASADGSAWTWDPATDLTQRHTPSDMGIVDRPQRAQRILARPGHVDVGGSFSITRHDLAAGTSRSVFVPGEPKALVDAGDRAYLAIYPIAEVWEWPPTAATPNRLTQLPPDQLRPIDLTHVAQLDCLLVTTTDDRTRSALHTVDPVTGRVDTVVNPLGAGQTAAGVHAHGTTAYVGGSGNAPAVASFNLMTGQKVWQVDDAVPGGGFVLGLAVVGSSLVVSTARGWLARISLATTDVVQRRDLGVETGQLVRRGSRLLLASHDRLLEVDPLTLATTPVLTGLGAQVWGWPPLSVGPDGRAWVIAGRDLAHD